MFFFKKKASVKTHEDRDQIDQNYKAVEGLIVLAGSNADFVAELKELQEKLKYLIATEDKTILGYDKKIGDLIGDMRIALTKGDGEANKKVDNLMTQIKLAITDRNAKM